MPRKAKQGEVAPRLPHANDIEFLAAFKGFVEACESKSISEKTYRAQYASECYSRHMDLVISQIDAGVLQLMLSHDNPTHLLSPVHFSGS